MPLQIFRVDLLANIDESSNEDEEMETARRVPSNGPQNLAQTPQQRSSDSSSSQDLIPPSTSHLIIDSETPDILIERVSGDGRFVLGGISTTRHRPDFSTSLDFTSIRSSSMEDSWAQTVVQTMETIPEETAPIAVTEDEDDDDILLEEDQTEDRWQRQNGSNNEAIVKYSEEMSETIVRDSEAAANDSANFMKSFEPESTREVTTTIVESIRIDEDKPLLKREASAEARKDTFPLRENTEVIKSEVNRDTTILERFKYKPQSEDPLKPAETRNHANSGPSKAEIVTISTSDDSTSHSAAEEVHAKTLTITNEVQASTSHVAISPKESATKSMSNNTTVMGSSWTERPVQVVRPDQWGKTAGMNYEAIVNQKPSTSATLATTEVVATTTTTIATTGRDVALCAATQNGGETRALVIDRHVIRPNEAVRRDLVDSRVSSATTNAPTITPPQTKSPTTYMLQRNGHLLGTGGKTSPSMSGTDVVDEDWRLSPRTLSRISHLKVIMETGATNGEQQDGADVIHHHPVFVKDTSKYWYKPTISREEAIAMLKTKPPGTFVVRDSNSFPGAFGLALKVAQPPAGVSPADGTELVRHFLIEPSNKGVRLKGCSNEPVFGTLAALVYQHSITPLALPCRLILPEYDPASTPEHINSNQALLERGAACNVAYLCSVDTESLTGPEALRRSTTFCFELFSRRELRPIPVHFKVSAQGITLTDNTRTLFFRRHYPVTAVTYAGIDPESRTFDNNNVSHLPPTYVRQAPIFGFVARKAANGFTGGYVENCCHVFAELDPDQPASAVVRFVTNVMMPMARAQLQQIHKNQQ